MNDSIFTKMMLSLQESKAKETAKNLKTLKESKLNEETEIEVDAKDIETPIDEVEVVEPEVDGDQLPEKKKELNESKKSGYIIFIKDDPDGYSYQGCGGRSMVRLDMTDALDVYDTVEQAQKEVNTYKNPKKIKIMKFDGKNATELNESCNKLSEESTEEDNEEVTESVSQDSQIKTTNKGTEVKELDGIKPATGADGIPDGSVNKKKLDEDVAVSTDGDITIKDGGRLIEISDGDAVETEADVCPECGKAECECEPETEEAVEPAETEEDLEVIDEPVEEEEEFIDESTFNPFLTKFIKDNYSNAKAVVVEGVKMNNKELTLECKTLFNSGKTSKFNLGLRGIVREGKVCKLKAYDNGYFKAESVKAPLTFKVSYKNNTLRCEGLEYNFNTKLTEGKIKNIKGKLIIK